jgi:hypothetical protein
MYTGLDHARSVPTSRFNDRSVRLDYPKEERRVWRTFPENSCDEGRGSVLKKKGTLGSLSARRLHLFLRLLAHKVGGRRRTEKIESSPHPRIVVATAVKANSVRTRPMWAPWASIKTSTGSTCRPVMLREAVGRRPRATASQAIYRRSGIPLPRMTATRMRRISPAKRPRNVGNTGDA